MVSKTSRILAQLPFCHITNVELHQLLESVESHIKSCRDDNNVSKHIRTTLPDNTIFKTPCKYYTTDQLANLNKKYDNTILKLLHRNIRSLDKYYGELVALIQTLGNNFDFIALTEIGQTKIESREASLRKLGFKFKYVKPDISKGGPGGGGGRVNI